MFFICDFSFYTYAYLCLVGLHWAVFISYHFSYYRMSLISWFSSPSLDVPFFLLILYDSTTGWPFICSNGSCLISKSLFCYLKSSHFSSETNHLFLVPSSSRIALIETYHLISLLTSFDHLLLPFLHAILNLSSYLSSYPYLLQ